MCLSSRPTPNTAVFYACLISAALLLIDWPMWFARPLETEVGEVVQSAAS